MEYSEAVTITKPAEKAETQTHRSPNYLVVFVVLAVITAIITTVELVSHTWGIPRGYLNAFYVSMSVTKAALVAMYYMHLKHDSRLYTVLFGTPVLFALVFVIILAV